MTDRVRAISYIFDSDGIKANIDNHEDCWRVTFTRITTSDAASSIQYIEDIKWATAEHAIAALDELIRKRRSHD